MYHNKLLTIGSNFFLFLFSTVSYNINTDVRCQLMGNSLKLIRTIFILTLTLSLTSCFSLGEDTGLNTFVKESSNSRHDKKVILFLKESALSSDSYQVIVCDNNHKLDKGEVGNTFTVDTNHGETFLGTESINFTWFGNDTLQIAYDKKLRTFIQEKKIDDVVIIYITK